MANTSYPKGMEKVLAGSINFAAHTIKAALLPSTYTFSTSHEFLSQLGTRVGTDQELAGKSVAGGTFTASDLDFGAVASGSVVRGIVIYKETGNPGTSPVLFFIDTAPGLPFSTSGSSITVPWSSQDGIAKVGSPFYPKGAEKLLSGAVNFAADTIKVALVRASYQTDAAHEFLAAVGTRIGTDQALANKVVAGGAFDADDSDFGAIAAGEKVGGLVIYKDTGSAATSPLLLHITDVVGLPYDTNGGGLAIGWPDGAAKIFSLNPA